MSLLYVCYLCLYLYFYYCGFYYYFLIWLYYHLGVNPPGAYTQTYKSIQQYNNKLGVRSAQYYPQMYGDHNASVLAREWCRRLQYFYNCYLASGDPHHAFTAEDIAAYRPLPEFPDVLAGLAGRALQQARELAKLVPHE